MAFIDPCSRIITIAAAVIRDERGRMLLVRKRGTEAFMQPGGKIDPGEEPALALRRELKEELGVEIDTNSLRHVGQFEAPAANEEDHVVRAEIFEVSSISGDPEPASEIEEIVWVDRASVKGLALAPLTRDEILSRYL